MHAFLVLNNHADVVQGRHVTTEDGLVTTVLHAQRMLDHLEQVLHVHLNGHIFLPGFEAVRGPPCVAIPNRNTLALVDHDVH